MTQTSTSGTPEPDPSEREAVARSRRRIPVVEIVTVIAIAGACAVLVTVTTDGLQRVMYDSFRDMAWAHNILAGRVWADPVLLEQPYWYAPGNPLLFAAVAELTGSSVVGVYRSSALWWNALIPVLLYLSVRAATDRLTAVLALPLVWLGSLWWMTHLAAPMPSVQGTALGLAGVLCWQWSMGAAERSDRWTAWRPLATGVVIAAAAWYHPICGLMAGGAIGLHTVALSVWPGTGGAALRRKVLLTTAVAGATAVLMVLPLIVHLVGLPKRNLVPLSYFANELANPDFALQLHAPLVLVLAVIGGWRIARTEWRGWWVLGYLVVAGVGQMLGYLDRWLGVDVPYLLPHEFQWHWQLAVGICAAVGVVHVGRALERRLPWPREPWVARLLWIGGPLVAALAPALPYLGVADAYLVDVRRVVDSRREVVEWMQTSTPIDAVIACTPQTGYLTVAGLTGRKCVAVPIGHLNPSVEGRLLLDELRTLLATDDEGEFLKLARRHRVSYLLIDTVSPNRALRLSQLLQWRSLRPVFENGDRTSLVFEIRGDNSERTR
jgi:hypothetical protein